MDGKAEQESVLFRDEKCIIIPNFDFQKSQDLRQLHLLAFPVFPDLLSLRCLTSEHLGLLESIQKEGLRMIEENYGILANQVKLCVHYQPTFYWLHIHLVSASQVSASLDCLRSHLLSQVIQNIRLKSDYYQTVSLEYQLPGTHPLASALL